MVKIYYFGSLLFASGDFTDTEQKLTVQARQSTSVGFGHLGNTLL